MSEIYFNRKKITYEKGVIVLRELSDVEQLTIKLNTIFLKKNNFKRLSTFKIKKKYYFRKFLNICLFLLLEKDILLINLKNSFFYLDAEVSFMWAELKIFTPFEEF